MTVPLLTLSTCHLVDTLRITLIATMPTELYGEQDPAEVWNNVVMILASLPPSSVLAHLHLTLAAPASPPQSMDVEILWDAITRTLSRFDKLAFIELGVLPFFPGESTSNPDGVYDSAMSEFFKRPVDAIFPATRRYSPRVIFQDGGQ